MNVFDGPSTSKRSKSRPGTTNKGQQYEILLPALLCLKFFQDENITDFILKTNIQNFGCFDDLIVTLVLSDGRIENYALQLKHKEKQNLHLRPEALEEGKSDFSIIKYRESFAKIRDVENYRFIIYTNAYFIFEELTKFIVQESGECSGKKFFFLPSNENEKANIYTFSLKESDDIFFKKFSFYTAQKDWREVEDLITETFEKIFHTRDSSIAMSYINIFKFWNLCQYSKLELSKEDLKIRIFDLILSPYIVAPSVSNSDGILEPEFSKFDVAIIRNLEDASVSKLTSNDYEQSQDILLRWGKNMKFLTRDAKDFSPEIKRKIGYYKNEKPILLQINNINNETIIATISELKKSQDKLHFVLVGENINKDDFPNLIVFETLQDLIDHDRESFHELANKMKMLIRGEEYSFTELFGRNISWAQHINIEHIAKMILGELCFNTNEEILSQPYISRHVTSSFIKIDSDNEISHDLLVLSYKENERIPNFLGKSMQRKPVTVEEYLNKEIDEKEILISQKNITKEEFDLIVNKSSSTNVHNLAAYDGEYFEWISTKGSIQNLKNCEIVRKVSTHESEIFEKYQNQVNVVASAPGTGKSELLKKLKNICPRKFFPIYIQMKEHEAFLKNDNSDQRILSYFLNLADDYIFAETKKSLADKRRIYFFFDGIDELRSENINVGLENIKKLVSMGFKVWMSSRTHIQEEIEDYFNIFAINISNFSDKDQESYIRERLRDRNDVDKAVEIIFGNVRSILENRNVLDVPLQLFMITEIFINREEITSEFVLTKMFHHFFVGKYRHFFNKNKCCHWDSLKSVINDSIKFRKIQYQIAALKSSLNSDEFASLKLKQDEYFLKQITSEGDFLGLISKIVHKIAIFNHSTVSIYFAALWLAENHKKVDRETLRLILLKKENDTIKLMFDMILAEDFSAHVAVLYRNIEDLKSFKNRIEEVDSGGRSVLHLACLHSYRCSIETIDYDKTANVRKVDEQFRKILNYLLEEDQDPLKTESVLRLNCLEIANETMSLLPLDVFLEKRPNLSNIIKNLNIVKHNNDKILFYCTIFGYSHLFENVYQDSSKMEDLLHLAAMWNSWRILTIILDKGVDVDLLTSSGKTPLHISSSLGHLQNVVLLLLKDANPNAVDKYGRTPLHFAAANGHLLVAKKLLDCDARIDPIDRHGRTPLHLAVEKGHEKLIEYLLDERKANINKVAHNGWGPIHLAVVENRPEIVKMLLDRNAHFAKMDQYGTKPIHLAARSSSVEILKMLLQKCGNVDDLTNDFKTSLHIAAEHGNAETFGFLLKSGANINACDDRGRSVMHWAVIGKQPRILALLLQDDKIEINVFDNNKRSALLWACELGDLLSVELLLTKMSTLIKFQDLNGATPLHWAAYGGHTKIVEVLLSNGAHIDAEDFEGRTPRQWAVLQHQQETIDLLERTGTRSSFLYSQRNNRRSS